MMLVRESCTVFILQLKRESIPALHELLLRNGVNVAVLAKFL